MALFGRTKQQAQAAIARTKNRKGRRRVGGTVAGSETLMLVGNRSTIPQTQRANSNGHTEFQQWGTYVVVEACRTIRVVDGNFDKPPAGGPSARTMRIGLKSSNTTTGVNGIWESTGTIDVTLAPGAVDACVFSGNFTAGQILYLVGLGKFATAPANWPCYVIDGTTSSQVNETGNGLTDKTTLNSIPGSRAVPDALWRPIAIQGMVAAPVKPYRILLLGDSITSAGQNDTGNTINGSIYNGWAQRALADSYPWANNGYAGLPLSVVAGENAAQQAIRNAAISGSEFTHVLIAAITNDLSGVSNAGGVTTTLNNLATLVARYGALGLKVIVCTSPPRTDAANTAPSGYGTGTGRDTFNATIKTTYAGRCLDIASVMQDAGNPQLWRTDLGTPTIDGVHPAPVIHNAAVAYANAQLPALFSA